MDLRGVATKIKKVVVISVAVEKKNGYMLNFVDVTLSVKTLTSFLILYFLQVFLIKYLWLKSTKHFFSLGPSKITHFSKPYTKNGTFIQHASYFLLCLAIQWTPLKGVAE